MRQIMIISGSSRANSQSRKVGNYFASQLDGRYADTTTNIIDLAETHLPQWDDSFWQNKPQIVATTSKQLTEADGFVVISPEWSGMVPPQLMNLFLLCNDFEVAHKPALIVSVSSGQNGAYPVSQLRSNAYKNNKICFMPEHIIVKDVNNVLNEPVAVSEADKYIRDRIDFSMDILLNYVDALKCMREMSVDSYKKYPYGM